MLHLSQRGLFRGLTTTNFEIDFFNPRLRKIMTIGTLFPEGSQSQKHLFLEQSEKISLYPLKTHEAYSKTSTNSESPTI